MDNVDHQTNQRQKKTSPKNGTGFLWREGELNSRPSADGYVARAMLQKKTSPKNGTGFCGERES